MPAEGAEVGVVQRLYAHREAVDPGVAVAAEAAGLDGGGVGFERDLGAGRERPAVGDRGDDGGDGLGGHQAGGAAAEEDGVDEAAGGGAGRGGDLRHQRALPAGGVDAGTDVAVEVAIRALGGTERPVDVDAEAAGAPVLDRWRGAVRQSRRPRGPRRRRRGG